jgi:hypothetical protein
MSKAQDIFVVMFCNGKAETRTDNSLFNLLQSIAHSFNTSAYGDNPPQKLFINGDLYIDSDLAGLAWKYDSRRRELLRQAEIRAKNEFTPDWMDTIDESDFQ